MKNTPFIMVCFPETPEQLDEALMEFARIRVGQDYVQSYWDPIKHTYGGFSWFVTLDLEGTPVIIFDWDFLDHTNLISQNLTSSLNSTSWSKLGGKRYSMRITDTQLVEKWLKGLFEDPEKKMEKYRN